jgi:NADPH:quinone reductase-like Zn-dependent oxidoreductase
MKPMRILVCGGRHFEDAEKIHRELSRLHWRRPVTVLIHGSVSGVGIAAEAWARRIGIAVVRYPPNWEFFGKRAEALRNAFMIEDSRADLVLAFPGGRHTADLAARASDAGIAVLTIPAGEVDHGPEETMEIWPARSDVPAQLWSAQPR